MKKMILLALCGFAFVKINAQCTESVTSFGNNTSTPSYNVSGDVSVVLNTNNTITLNLASNFSTASGPDVRAYLVNSDGKTDAQLKSSSISNLDNLEFGLVNATGVQTFTITIPTGKDITKFNKIIFYCLQFGVFWDVGSFTPFMASNCTVLDVDAFNNTDVIKIYPNPVKNKIQLSNVGIHSAEIRIFNILGKQVFYQSKITERTIDVSTLEKGIYLIEIRVDRKIRTQKLVIQ